MKKNIAEDLPARKHPQAQMSTQSKSPERSERGSDRDDDKGEKTPEQKIRQAVYDIRYRARRENVPLRTAYSQYMQNSSMAESEKSVVRQKLFGKDGGMQAENFKMDLKRSASDSMAKALYKVFVEKKDEVVDLNQLKMDLEEKAHFNKYSTSETKKYKVRVTDKKSNVTYVRYANREKISQLRAKGLEVEMTEYGTPYEGEKQRGEQTATALGGGKAKKDYDGDGKVESGAKEYRGSVHNAIQRKKGGVPDGKDTSSVKEEFMKEIAPTANLPQTDAPQIANSDTNAQQIDFTTKKNKIVINPPDSSQTKLMAHYEIEGEVIAETGYSKFLEILKEKKMTKEAKKKEKKLKKKYDPSGMKASMEKQYGEKKGKEVYFATIRKQAMKEASECENDDAEKMNLKKDEKMDARAIPTAMSIAKLGARYRGVKNPIMMVASEECEVVDETTKLFYKLQKAGKGGSKTAQAQLRSDAKIEDQKSAKIKRQQARQRQEKESREDEEHPSLSARERNPNLR